jgi:hypothetical protein
VEVVALEAAVVVEVAVLVGSLVASTLDENGIAFRNLDTGSMEGSWIEETHRKQMSRSSPPSSSFASMLVVIIHRLLFISFGMTERKARETTDSSLFPSEAILHIVETGSFVRSLAARKKSLQKIWVML